MPQMTLIGTTYLVFESILNLFLRAEVDSFLMTLPVCIVSMAFATFSSTWLYHVWKGPTTINAELVITNWFNRIKATWTDLNAVR